MPLLVFMYHRVLPEEHPDAVSVPLFRRQLAYLRRHFRVLSPAETCRYLRGEEVFPGRCAALTFDDGFLDNLLYADPLLREAEMSAMMAVSAGFMEDSPLVRTEESPEILRRTSREAADAAAQGDRRSYLTAGELRQLAASGVWSLEAHGTRHRTGARGKSVLCAPQNEPVDRFERELRADILNCRAKLDALTGRTGRVFFWPYGHYSSQAAEIVRDCGYDLQFSVCKGACRPGDRRPVLPRIGVSRWGKFRKNCIVFGDPLLAALRDLFPREQVRFDEFYREA